MLMENGAIIYVSYFGVEKLWNSGAREVFFIHGKCILSKTVPGFIRYFAPKETFLAVFSIPFEILWYWNRKA